MVIVALDTTTRAGSVAVTQDQRVLVSRSGDPGRTHGERLPHELLQALDEVGLSVSDVDRYGVCSGPGSFTGLRVGLATIQGLAMACERPVVPVPTLEALAYAGLWSHSGTGACSVVVPWMHAQRGEVFAAVYRATDGRLEPVGIPVVGRAVEAGAQLLPAVGDGTVLLVGDAVDTAPEGLGEAVALRSVVVTDPLPLAEVVARLAADVGDERIMVPHAIRPVYVRRSDAELARDRRRRERRDAPA